MHFGLAVGRVEDEIRASVGDADVLGPIVSLAADPKADDPGFAGFGHAVGGRIVGV